ncbi:hypothetical protein NQZ68_016184 [Dissostichus eleginoides]|nr:hypothetical protein NQZ68_016184 [Dissostichus eleginoides]
MVEVKSLELNSGDKTEETFHSKHMLDKTAAAEEPRSLRLSGFGNISGCVTASLEELLTPEVPRLVWSSLLMDRCVSGVSVLIER